MQMLPDRGGHKSSFYYSDLNSARKRKHEMITRAITGLFLVASISCIVLCVYKRVQCKKEAPKKPGMNEPSQDETSLVD
jgi:hypothetical protein